MQRPRRSPSARVSRSSPPAPALLLFLIAPMISMELAGCEDAVGITCPMTDPSCDVPDLAVPVLPDDDRVVRRHRELRSKKGRGGWLD